jgi:CheY-like chemotaxis protein
VIPPATAAGIGIDVLLARPDRQRMLLFHELALVAPEWSARSGTAAAESVRVGFEAGLHILVAHDIAINHYVAAGMLTSQDHTTGVAGDEAEAINKAVAFDYNGIFVDIPMPRMNGIGATSAICSFFGSKTAVPIFAMTANTVNCDRTNL